MQHGQLLAGEYPGAYEYDRAKTRLEALVQAGIRTFIDLTERRDPLQPYEPVLVEIGREQQLDLRYYRFGIRDGDIPATEVMTQVLGCIRTEIANSRPTYVHCWGGIGRTGTAVGCWLVEQGRTPEEALREIASLRATVPDCRMRSPETDRQCDFVREWRSKA